ncbi:MAG: hypothetical protein WEA11_08295 [Acidimicrobiales bacterium]
MLNNIEGFLVAKSKSVPEILQDLWDLLVAYARQETIDPLRNIGRYVAFGIGGMAFITAGVLLFGLSGLRALQTQTGELFAGFWSWVPYLVIAVIFGGFVAWAISRIGKGDVGTQPQRPQTESKR